MYFIVNTSSSRISPLVSAARNRPTDSQKYDTAKLDYKKQNEEKQERHENWEA